MEKEQVDKIMTWNGTDIETEKAKTTKAEGERDNYKGQLDTATGQLEQFKDVKPEELQETIKKLQDDLKLKDEEYAAKETNRIFTENVREAVKTAGGRNDKAVLAMLDMDALKDSKNQTEDIKKALETIKETDAYLFGANEPINNPVVGPTGGSGNTDSGIATMRAAMGLPAEEK